ncbi:biotin transport system substrate-specific component [Sanguibacter gelidistatuariae]|uniref:Biotin transporter n=1 Tax=Sanguibacter gelidistatuariae TaxID=1814289 RepID=A0A1G6TJA8_9MICO|nr:biotin transporter BioY [Sanguibacter gelidistatuariae]SDD29178.1 biotin transport system substrate-specific component [Sanguibacter gelidistatuariae]
MSSAALSPAATRPVLADLVPTITASRTLTDALLVGAGTLFVAAFAQLSVTLPFTPVPITLSSFAVLLTGAALGSRRGALSMALYVLAGVLGAPFYADGASGWAFASFGYVLAYLPAAVVAGHLARRGSDRTPWGTVALVAAASATIYVPGVIWLMTYLDVNLTTALALGVTPFLIGDAVKALALGAVLPTAWKVVGRKS